MIIKQQAGVVNHHILHIYHVTETENHLVWDLAFLAPGIVLIVGGLLVIGTRKAHNDRNEADGLST